MDEMAKKREFQDFWSKTICPTVQKLFIGETFSGSIIKGFKKDLDMRGISGLSLGNLLSYSTGKLFRGNFLCITKFPVSKKFWDVGGGGVGREFHDFPSN